MNPAQLDGITKARLIYNAANPATAKLTDADYIAFVCADVGLAELPIEAADSYAAQHAGKTIAELEAAWQQAEAKRQQSEAAHPPATDA